MMSVANPNKRERPDSGLMEEQDMELRPMDDEDDDEDDPSAGDKLHMRLLLMEDKQRSALMWKQVSAFQEKVTASLNAFSPEDFLTNLRALSSLPNQNRIVASSIHSLARLRMVVQQQLRAASMRSDGSIYFAGAQGESSRTAKCTQYFVWFFEFMDYLHELHDNFVERIFLPLFKFFHEISFLGGRSRASTAASTFSKISLMSLDSGSGDAEEAADNVFNGYGGHNGSSGNHSRQEVDDDMAIMSVDTARRRAQSRTALQLLSQEFKEIKSLYDTADVDKVVQRLSVLKDQLDFILEEEDEMDPDLFSAESGQRLYPLEMDEGTENLVRLPIDLLVKFRKAAWLTQRWLQLYDKRTHDLNTKLNKVQTLEHNLTRRLQSLDGNIVQHERQLERQTDQLYRLMKREERTDGLGLTLYDIEVKAAALKEQLAALKRQRDTITADIKAKVAQKGRAAHHEYRRLKLDFEKNKLQRYQVERRLATLDYQRHLAVEDRSLELEVRPCLIRHTNHLQDSCERLEQTIRQERQERDNIRNALLPVQEDRQVLSDKVSRLTARPPDHGEGGSGEGGGGERGGGGRRLRAGQAKFVRTYHVYNNNKNSAVNVSNNNIYNKNNVVMSAATPTPPGARGGVGLRANGSRLAVSSPPPAAVPGWVSPPEW